MRKLTLTSLVFSFLLITIVLTCQSAFSLTISPGYWQNDDVYYPQYTSTGSDSDIYGRYSGTLNPAATVPYDLTGFNAWSAGRDSPEKPDKGNGYYWSLSNVSISGDWIQTDFYAGLYYKTVPLYTASISNATLSLKQTGPWSDEDFSVINMTGIFSVWQGIPHSPTYPHIKASLTGSFSNYDITFFVALTEMQPPPYDGAGEVNCIDTSIDGSIAWSLQVTPAPVPEPATILLLASGLVGLVGYNRKLRKR